tara:strand:+ start:232 stop:372 length:141 start_codon:yes stop_codon:yes gene_type:complete
LGWSPLLNNFSAKAIFLRHRQVPLRATLSQASENYTNRYQPFYEIY